MLKVLIILLHIVASLILIGVVLLQSGKRADLAGAFGGGGSQTAFGARGAATLLSKATTSMAVVFMLTSLSLSIMSGRVTAGGSVLEEVDSEQQTQEQSGDAGAAATPPPPAGDAETEAEADAAAPEATDEGSVAGTEAEAEAGEQPAGDDDGTN